MTPATLDNWVVTVLGSAIGLAALGAAIGSIAVIIQRLRKPPPANVITSPSGQIVIGLVSVLTAALFAAVFMVSSDMSRGGLAAAIAIVASFSAMGAALLARAVRWRLVIEPDGLVHRGVVGSRRVTWDEIRVLRVLRGGAIICVLRPRGSFVVLANAPNNTALLPAARSAGVPIEPP